MNEAMKGDGKGKGEAVKLAEAVRAAMAASPKAFAQMKDKRVAKMVKLVLAEVGRKLDAADKGRFRVSGLGSFTVRKKEVEKDGKKTAVKRIVFRRAKAGPGKGKAGKGGKGGKGLKAGGAAKA